jgi:large subunit ribosomal protein L21
LQAGFLSYASVCCILREAASLKKREVLFVYAVIVTGGKQYKVAEGDIIFVEKLDVEVESEITFDEVLAVGEGENIKIGAPTVDGAVVKGKVLKIGKGKKLHVMTYKPKKNQKRKLGHRQPFTKIQIESIAG